MSTDFTTINEIKRANKQLGHYWFHVDTVSYFDDTLESGVIDGSFFIHSIKHKQCDREYLIAFACGTGAVETVGPKFKNINAARAWINEHGYKYSDCGDGETSRQGKELHVRVPTHDSAGIFLNYRDYCSMNIKEQTGKDFNEFVDDPTPCEPTHYVVSADQILKASGGAV